MHRGLSITILSVAALLTACHRPAPLTDLLYAETGYLCTAVSTLHPEHLASAWSKKPSVAKAYALSRCQSTSRQIVDCKIQECIYTGSTTEVSTARWYTCYINNRDILGVWVGTSHNRLEAVKWAFNRCVLLSGKASACYVNYCRLW